MNLNNLDDIKKIVKGCQRGERKYQEILHQALYSGMFKICLQYAKDEQEAESFLYDGFLKLYERIDKYTFKGSFTAWVRRLFINNILDSLRKSDAINTIHIESFENINVPKDNEEVRNPQMSAEKIIEALQNVSPLQRSIFNLFVMEDLSHKEIAKLLNIKPEASKSYYYKCRKNILKQLTEEDQSYTDLE